MLTTEIIDTIIEVINDAIERTEYVDRIRKLKAVIPAVTGESSLAFSVLQQINTQRATRWHKKGLAEWTLSDWLMAFGGEAGEALNAGKKYKRLLDGIQQHGNVPSDIEDAATKVMEELADTVIYADLCASLLGRNLGDAIRNKFNATSIREGFPERI